MTETIDISAVMPEMIPEIAALDNICFNGGWSEAAITESFFNGHSIMLAAVQSKKIVGYIFADYVLDEVYINRIAAAPSKRRGGIAFSLLCALEERVWGFASFITLEVRKSNSAARALYQKSGFNIVGERARFYDNPCEDAVLMTKTRCLAPSASDSLGTK